MDFYTSYAAGILPTQQIPKNLVFFLSEMFRGRWPFRKKTNGGEQPAGWS